MTAAILVTLIVLIALTAFLNRAQLPAPSPNFPVSSLKIAQWTLRYHQSGNGQNILLLHGIGANLYCWRTLIPGLSSHFQVTAIDLPGFGLTLTEESNPSFDLDTQVRRLVQILDALKIEKTFVVGNSMGGNIALWMAKLHPERVSKCVVIAPATSPRLIRIPLQRLLFLAYPTSIFLNRAAMNWAHRRTVSKKHLVDRDRVNETYRTYGLNVRAIKNFMLATAAIQDRRLPQALEGLQLPTLILWGSRDKLVSRQVIDQLQTSLPNAQSFIHIGGGHHLQEDEPEWVSEKLVEFFSSQQD